MKTALTTAAYDGKLDELRALLARGADANGDDEPKYTDKAEGCLTGAPYYTPLGEAARAGHAGLVAVLLAAGVEVDKRNYRNETAFVLAAQRGHLEVMRALEAAGADVHAVCCMGNALAYAVTSSDRSRECILHLIELGVKADVSDPFTRSAVDHLVDDLPKSGKLDKWQKKTLEVLEWILPAAGREEASAKKALERFGKKAEKQKKSEAKTEASFTKLGSAEAVRDKKWEASVRAFIKPVGEAREDLERLCRLTLATKPAIAHAKWPALVRAIVAASRTYADATKEAYGERLTIAQMDEDEGSVLDAYADDHEYTFDWVLVLLAKPDAVASKHWPELVQHVCEAKAKAIGHMSFGDTEIAALLAAPAAKKHPKHAALVKVARRAFPFATLVLMVLAVVGCKGHDEKGERDSKGRSSAVIGAPTATATVAVRDAAALAPPAVETSFASMSWTGSITQSTGAAPAVGTACTLSTHGRIERHDALVVKCGDKTLYDEADAIDGPTADLFGADEHPVAGKVSVFTYELVAQDIGPRTGRNQIKVDTRKGTLSVFRETIPTFRVSIAIAQKRDEREGLPLDPDNVPAFRVVAKATATLTSSKGPLPFTGKSCELRISPGTKSNNCRIQLECAKKIVYGTNGGGYSECFIRGGQPISFSDQKPTPVDHDPALTADLDAKTATFGDEPAGGVPFTASFTLATP